MATFHSSHVVLTLHHPFQPFTIPSPFIGYLPTSSYITVGQRTHVEPLHATEMEKQQIEYQFSQEWGGSNASMAGGEKSQSTPHSIWADQGPSGLTQACFGRAKHEGGLWLCLPQPIYFLVPWLDRWLINTERGWNLTHRPSFGTWAGSITKCLVSEQLLAQANPASLTAIVDQNNNPSNGIHLDWSLTKSVPLMLFKIETIMHRTPYPNEIGSYPYWPRK